LTEQRNLHISFGWVGGGAKSRDILWDFHGDKGSLGYANFILYRHRSRT